MSCPSCGSATVYVIRTKRLPDGTPNRRFECNTCRERWNSTEPDHTKRSAPRRLDTEAVRAILTEPTVSNRMMAIRFGIGQEFVRRIRCGESYRDVLPEIPRPGSPGRAVCTRCIQWHSDRRRCLLGFPDPHEESVLFAAECCCFNPQTRT